jgi:hypothetical protein
VLKLISREDKSMFTSLKYRITAIAGALVIMAGFSLTLTSSPVYASNPVATIFTANNDAGTYGDINAWGGGPYVKFFVGTIGDTNSYFNLINAGSGYDAIQFIGDGSYSNDCVGDYGNLSGNADTGLVACPGSSQGAGWGTLMSATSCTDGQGNYGDYFYDKHWQGYLAPGSYSNGSKLYLNSTPTCWFESYIVF